jgi:hypothetical protein
MPTQPMLRLKFLYVVGGGAWAAAMARAHVAEAAELRALGETISVPPNPLHGVIAIAVQVNPLKNLQRVELFIDGKLLDVDTDSPFAFVWDTRTGSDGTHVLRADSVYRNRRHSGSVSVIVDNANGTATIFPSLTLYPSETLP